MGLPTPVTAALTPQGHSPFILLFCCSTAPQGAHSAPGRATPISATTNSWWHYLPPSPKAGSTSFPPRSSAPLPRQAPSQQSPLLMYHLLEPDLAKELPEHSLARLNTVSILQGNHPAPPQLSQIIKPRHFIRIRWVGKR